MGNLGFQEIMLIFVIALIVFGPKKLPELGKAIGKGLAEFRRASNELRNTWEEEVRMEDLKKLEKMADPYEPYDATSGSPAPSESVTAPNIAASAPAATEAAHPAPAESAKPAATDPTQPTTHDPGKA